MNGRVEDEYAQVYIFLFPLYVGMEWSRIKVSVHGFFIFFRVCQDGIIS